MSDEYDEEEERLQAPKGTAPLRLQSALRWEPIDAALSGDYSILGSQRTLIPPSRVFHDLVIPSCQELDLKVRRDATMSLGLFLLEIPKVSSDIPHAFIEEERLHISRTSELIKRQAKVVHLGATSSLAMQCPPKSAIPKEVWAYSYVRSRIQDWLAMYIDHNDGKSSYVPQFAVERGETLVWVIVPGKLEFHLHGRTAGYVRIHKSIQFLPMNTARAWHEVVASRTLVLIAGMMDEYWKKESRLPWAELIDSMSRGDWVLAMQGNPGYNVIKNLEAVVIGAVSSEDDDDLFFDNTRYLRAVTTDRSRAGNRPQDAFYDSVISIVKTHPSRHAAFQLFGMFRMWGYPHVDILGGIRKVKEVATAAITPDLSIAKDGTCMAKEIFYSEYHRKQGHFPPSNYPTTIPDMKGRRLSEVLEALTMGREINRASANYSLRDWEYVMPKKLFEAAEHLDELDLLSDKSCSATREELVKALSKPRPELPESASRRTIQRYLEMEEHDIAAFLALIDKHGFSLNDLVIGVNPKERELKIDPRLFSLMTPNVRMYFTATEHLLKECILPFYPSIAMGLSSREAKQVLDHRSGPQDGESDDVRLIANNMDFKRWNLHQRNAVLAGLFGFFDQLFGYTNVFNRTHEVFEQSTFYLADGFILPLADAIRDGLETDVTWRGHLGGMEGLRQKGWTIFTASLIKVIDYKHFLRSDLMGQGDNQILTTTLNLKKFGVEGEPDKKVVRVMRERYQGFLDDLADTFQRVGLPLKTSECWQSSCIFAFGKETFWKNKKMSMSLKRISRMFFISNEFYPSFYHSVASVFSNAESAADQDNDVRTPLFVALYELMNTVLFYWHWTPTAGQALKSCKGGQYKWYDPEDKKEYYTPPGGREAAITRHMHLLVEVISLSSHDFGGYACQNYYSLSVRGFTDMPSMHYGFAERYLALNKAEIDPRVYRAVVSHFSPVMREKMNPLLPAQNPYGLNIPHPVSFSMVARSASAALMRSPMVKNIAVRELTDIADHDQDDFLDILMEVRPFMPKVINLLFENSAPEIAKQTLAKFENSTSIKRAALRMRVHDATTMEEKIGTADSEVFSCFIFSISRPAATALNRDVFAELQKLRKLSFGQDEVAGVTSPPPFSYMSRCEVVNGMCRDCVFLSSAHTSAQVIPDRLESARLGLRKGPCRAYEGSETKQKVSSMSSARIENITSPVRAVKKITSIVGWLTTKNSRLCDLIEKQAASLTSVGFSNFVSETVDVDSSATHRLQDSHGHHHGAPGTLTTPFSCCDVSTNTMGKFADGAQDHPINYQHLICLVQLVATETAKVSAYHELHHYHVYDESFLPMLDDGEVELSDSALNLLVPLDLEKWEDNKFVFAKALDVSLRYRPTAFGKMSDYLDHESLTSQERAHIFNILCAQQIVRAIEYSLSRIHIGSPPAPELPYVWYSRCDPMTVLRLVIQRLPATIMGMGWSMLTERLYDNCLSTVAWNETLRTLTSSHLSAFQPVAGMLAISHVRQKILPYVTASEAPRGFPFTNLQLQESAKRILIKLLTDSRYESGFCFTAPYTHSLLEDQWTIGLFIKNAIGHFLTQGQRDGFAMEHSIKKHLSIISGLAAAIYNKATIVGEIAFTRESIRRISATFMDKLKGKKREHLCEGAILRSVQCAFVIDKLKLTQGSIKKIAPDMTPAKNERTLRTPVKFPSTHLRHNLLLKCADPGEVPMSDDVISSKSEPYRMVLRSIRNPTLAWYKYLTVLIDHKDQLSAVACLGDGTGGIAHLAGLFNKDCKIFFNSLRSVESGTTSAHTDNLPPALENGLGLTHPVQGISPMDLSITDLCDPLWPSHFSRIVGDTNLSLVTCDANYGPAVTGRLILENILQMMDEVRCYGAVFVMKVYFCDLGSVNRMIQCAHSVFRKVELFRSGFSAARSSESFLLCRGYTGGKARMLPVISSDLPVLTRATAVGCLSASEYFEPGAEQAVGEYQTWAASVWGHKILTTSRVNLLAIFGLVDEPSSWTQFCSLINTRAGHTLNTKYLLSSDQNEAGAKANTKRLTLIGAALVLGYYSIKYGGLEAVKEMVRDKRDWIGMIATYEGRRDKCYVWISPKIHYRDELYVTFSKQQNKLEGCTALFFVIPHSLWLGPEAEPIYRLFGMYLDKLRDDAEEFYPSTISIGSWSKKQPAPSQEFSWRSVNLPGVPKSICFAKLQ